MRFKLARWRATLGTIDAPVSGGMRVRKGSGTGAVVEWMVWVVFQSHFLAERYRLMRFKLARWRATLGTMTRRCQGEWHQASERLTMVRW